jgi:hypothetical protein
MELAFKKDVAYEVPVVEVFATSIRCDLSEFLSGDGTSAAFTVGVINGVRFNRVENRRFQVGDVVRIYYKGLSSPKNSLQKNIPFKNRQLADAVVFSIDKMYIKPLLIFDVHGVLGERVPFEEALAKSNGKKVVREFVPRPYCKEFLDFCFKHFEVAVWSSAFLKNMNLSMFDAAGGKKKRSPLFVWSQKEITDLFPVMSFHKSTKPLHLKDISTVWATFPSYDSSNSLLLDNDLEKGAVSD